MNKKKIALVGAGAIGSSSSIAGTVVVVMLGVSNPIGWALIGGSAVLGVMGTAIRCSMKKKSVKAKIKPKYKGVKQAALALRDAVTSDKAKRAQREIEMNRLWETGSTTTTV